MSDFIPPLISASPPPMPDFDDEDDDDVEFGMGCAIGDLDFSVTPDDDSNEKKDKILEIENRRLEIGVTTNNWKCEEQDSTSQDSGLCMASQSSEGMSPLPQSDDEDKNNLDHNHVHDNDEVSNNSMKHSSTVMFNKSNETNDKEISNNTTIAFDNNEGDDNVGSQTISLSDEVLPTDTGQDNTKLKRDIESDTDFNTEHEKSNFNNESDSDSEFVWNNTVDNDTDLFNNHDKEVFVNNDYDKDITANHDTSEIIVNHDSTILNHTSNLFVSSEETSISNEHPVNEVSPSTIENINNESSSTSHSVKCESVNNLCDSSFNNFNVINDVDQSIKCLNNDDDFDEDDFGNFASVTIPDCDSSINNNNNNSESDNNFSEFTSSSNAVVPTDESDEKDLKSDLESNTTDLEPKSDDIVFNNSSTNVSDLSSSILNKDSLNSCLNKSDNLNVNEYSDNKDFNEDDDEFDDFSDFTQSSDLPISYQKPEILKSEQSTIDQAALMNQDSFDHIFPKLENTYSEVHVDNLEGGPVWKHLSSLENSPALTFQWSNSKAHNKLLAALSIDSRNILFGPHWNTNIPRFAANLCANPLQPIKAAEPNPGFPSSSPIPPSSDEPAVVPDAHFDWVGSGLTNPLDCTSEKISSNNIEIERLNDGSKPSSAVDNLNILSNEAESIISLLPDLNFMKKTYIEILISKG